jgi:hypothetical protein
MMEHKSKPEIAQRKGLDFSWENQFEMIKRLSEEMEPTASSSTYLVLETDLMTDTV